MGKFAGLQYTGVCQDIVEPEQQTRSTIKVVDPLFALFPAFLLLGKIGKIGR